MQITYTHLDNSTTVFTANTLLSPNVCIGNSAVQTWANVNANGKSAWANYLTGNATATVIQGGVTYYYKQESYYRTDYGFSIWAKERLSSTDYQQWFSDVGGANLVEQNPGTELYQPGTRFAYWWEKFINDPNVVKTE